MIMQFNKFNIFKQMLVYTSYFGNIKNILKIFPDSCLISIAGKTPDWFVGEKCKKLMPLYEWWIQWHTMFKSNLDSEASKNWYIDKYSTTVLSHIDVQDIIQELNELASKRCPIFLLCYETPDRFCHRHIVAQWLQSHGILCKELKNEN